MPPRRRPQVYKDEPEATTTLNKDTDETQPPQKRRRRAALGQKHGLNIVASSGDSKASPGKAKPAGYTVEDVDAKRRVKRGKRTVMERDSEDLENLGHVKEEEEEENIWGNVKKRKLVDARSEKSSDLPPSPIEPEPEPALVLQQSLTDQVLNLLHSTHPSHKLTLLPSFTPNDVAEAITAKNLWTPTLLNLFKHELLTTLHFITRSPSTFSLPGNLSDPTPLLEPFLPLNTFTHLTHLSLARLPLDVGTVDFLRNLTNLIQLDLSQTGIDSVALNNLTHHRLTLQVLDITNNPDITDIAWFPLHACLALTQLYLRGTSFTMPGLRTLVYKLDSRPVLPMSASHDLLPQRPPIHLVTIPTACLDALNASPSYAVHIPSEGGYVKDLRLVDSLDVKMLKKNLSIHAKVNKGISLQGGKVELMEKLRKILEKRKGDELVRRAVEGPGVAAGAGAREGAK